MSWLSDRHILRAACTFILLAVAAGSLAFALPAAKAQERGRIVIGAVASLSGPAAEQGRNWLDGAVLASEELRNEGRSVLLSVEDDQSLPARVPPLVRKLVDVDGARALIGGTWDFLSEAAHPLAQQLKIPWLTPTNPPELVDSSARSNPYVFTNGLSLSSTEQAMRTFLGFYKPESAAIVVPNVSFGVLHASMLEKLAAQQGIRITSRSDFEYAGYQETLRALAARFARSEKPQLIFCLSDYSAIDVFVSQLELQRFFPLVLTTQHLDRAIEFSRRPSRYARSFGIYPQLEDTSFTARFNSRFGHNPRVYAANGYDAVRFLAAALEAGIDFAGPGFEYRGILGPYRISADTRGLLPADRAVIMGLQEGGFRALSLPAAQGPA